MLLRSDIDAVIKSNMAATMDKRACDRPCDVPASLQIFWSEQKLIIKNPSSAYKRFVCASVLQSHLHILLQSKPLSCLTVLYERFLHVFVHVFTCICSCIGLSNACTINSRMTDDLQSLSQRRKATGKQELNGFP